MFNLFLNWPFVEWPTRYTLFLYQILLKTQALDLFCKTLYNSTLDVYNQVPLIIILKPLPAFVPQNVPITIFYISLNLV